MNSTVSVIVPIYNVDKFLEECINSVVSQDYEDLEIILVDDGSTDKSSIICDQWRKKDERICVIHKENQGLGMARNSGLELATGKYVTFVDGDDYIKKDHISNLVSDITSENADICYAGFTFFDKNNETKMQNILVGQVIDFPESLRKTIPLMCGKSNPHKNDSLQMSVCMALYRKSLIEEGCILFPSERKLVSEDFIFNIEILKLAHKVVFSDDCGYHYRRNVGSLSTSYKKDKFELHKNFAIEILNRAEELSIKSECEQRIYSTFLSAVWFDIKGEQALTKKIGYKESVRNIKRFCDDEFTIEVLRKYDLSVLPKETKFIRLMMKYKMARLLWLMGKFKNK